MIENQQHKIKNRNLGHDIDRRYFFDSKQKPRAKHSGIYVIDSNHRFIAGMLRPYTVLFIGKTL
jgi:hypothetical protein